MTAENWKKSHRTPNARALFLWRRELSHSAECAQRMWQLCTLLHLQGPFLFSDFPPPVGLVPPMKRSSWMGLGYFCRRAPGRSLATVPFSKRPSLARTTRRPNQKTSLWFPNRSKDEDGGCTGSQGLDLWAL